VHEAKLCLSLLRIAEESARQGHARRILALRLEVGSLCGVVPEALAAAFPVCARGTLAEDAALELRRVPGRELVLRDLEVI